MGRDEVMKKAAKAATRGFRPFAFWKSEGIDERGLVPSSRNSLKAGPNEFEYFASLCCFRIAYGLPRSTDIEATIRAIWNLSLGANPFGIFAIAPDRLERPRHITKRERRFAEMLVYLSSKL
jgi:hypothetical protein